MPKRVASLGLENGVSNLNIGIRVDVCIYIYTSIHIHIYNDSILFDPLDSTDSVDSIRLHILLCVYTFTYLLFLSHIYKYI